MECDVDMDQRQRDHPIFVTLSKQQIGRTRDVAARLSQRWTLPLNHNEPVLGRANCVHEMRTFNKLTTSDIVSKDRHKTTILKEGQIRVGSKYGSLVAKAETLQVTAPLELKLRLRY